MPTPTDARERARGRILDLLRCPLCRERLAPADGALRCPARHTFDIARQGYVSLLSGGRRAASADTAAMVQAREEFLGAGHYAPLGRALAGLAREVCPPGAAVLDAGTGTGYYLAAVLDALPSAAGLGLDTSSRALRRAARAHARAMAATWDVWRQLPVRHGAFDLVLNVFAPRNGGEFHRVLRPGGALLVVTPAARHLAELREHAGTLAVDPAKEERLSRALDGHFTRERAEPLEYGLRLSADDIERLVAMGPSAHHVAPGELRDRVAALAPPVPVTASFTLSVYRPR